MDILDSGLTRRRFIASAAGSALSLAMANKVAAQVAGSSLGEHDRAIQGVRVGLPTALPNNFGDTWVAAWADDDNLYTPSNDTLGFDIPGFFTKEQVKLFQSDFTKFAKQLTAVQKKQFQYGPIAFNRVEGSDPMNLRGITVNRMGRD